MKAIAQVRHCENMAEVRACVDALDDALVPLIVTLCGYMTQAARIKGDARLVHDQARIDQIVARVREQAAAEGGNPGLLERIYRALIDCCMAHEHEELRRLQAGPDSASSSCAGAAP